ncbi:porin family protein [Flavobacterium sp. DGU38]|uniref:Porin family protein n=1 Tax=Flavobacterium calami TaxID=3139144 RepID=A0ABU9INS9_9FLAO|nr:porin family protein [Flavobacterium ajazii]
MKKVTLIAFVLFIGLITSQAQVKVSPGLRGGLNLSTLSNIEGNSYNSNFYIGGLASIKFNKYFTLQPELSYSKQGTDAVYFDYDNNGNYQTFDTTYDLDYVSLDVVAKFHFGGGGFHLLGGPFFDLKTNDNFNYSSDLVDFDMGIVAGVGYTLPNGLTFEARLKQGFIDIYGFEGIDDYNENGNYDEVILNNVFQFGVSYTFKM